MPDFSIVDSHVHLWDPTQFPIPWLSDVPAIDRPYEIATLVEDASSQPIAGIVYVEVDVAPQFALLETRMVVEMARNEPLLRGIVAAAPLEYGDQVRPYLDELATLGPLIKGVRRNLQGEMDPAFFTRPKLLHGLHQLGDYDFSFDICVRHSQIRAAAELVRQCPEVTFILDHLGKPDIRAQTFDPWRDDLAYLASFPNVACKLSGIITEADLANWQPADLAPYVAHALSVFGVERILFGGDWPVLCLDASYSQWLATVENLLANLPESAQKAIWIDNARRIYRLEM